MPTEKTHKIVIDKEDLTPEERRIFEFIMENNLEEQASRCLRQCLKIFGETWMAMMKKREQE